jgi:hypothetical protein
MTKVNENNAKFIDLYEKVKIEVAHKVKKQLDKMAEVENSISEDVYEKAHFENGVVDKDAPAKKATKVTKKKVSMEEVAENSHREKFDKFMKEHVVPELDKMNRCLLVQKKEKTQANILQQSFRKWYSIYNAVNQNGELDRDCVESRIRTFDLMEYKHGYTDLHSRKFNDTISRICSSFIDEYAKVSVIMPETGMSRKAIHGMIIKTLKEHDIIVAN